MKLDFQDVTFDVDKFIEHLEKLENLKCSFLKTNYNVIDDETLLNVIRIVKSLNEECEQCLKEKEILSKRCDEYSRINKNLKEKCEKLFEEKEELERYSEKLNHELNIEAAERDKEAIEKDNKECKSNGPFMQNITLDDLIDIILIKDVFGVPLVYNEDKIKIRDETLCDTCENKDSCDLDDVLSYVVKNGKAVCDGFKKKETKERFNNTGLSDLCIVSILKKLFYNVNGIGNEVKINDETFKNFVKSTNENIYKCLFGE